MKKYLSMLVIVLMMASLTLAGCSSQNAANDQTESDTAGESQPGEDEIVPDEPAGGDVSITDGYYYEDTTGLRSFYRFNEDGTWYGYFFDGGVVDAGTYKILDEELEYSVDGGADGDIETVEDNTMAVAGQIIEITSYKGGAVQKMAFVDDQLCDVSLGGMSNHKNMVHIADYDYNPDVDEIAIEIYLFYIDGSAGSTISLGHNNKFIDVTGDKMREGTWSMPEAGVFELEYEDSGKGKLTVAEDQVSAVLMLDSGEEIELLQEGAVSAEGIVLSLAAQGQEVGLPMEVDVRIDCYGDGTCKVLVYVAAVDADLEADSGTYALDEAFQITFDFEGAGAIAGETDYESATETSLDMSVSYQADVTVDFSGNETPLSIHSELAGTYSMN